MPIANTGARVSEVADLKVGDLSLAAGGSPGGSPGGSLHIRGKGRKQRVVPLWRETVRVLRRWIGRGERPPQAPLLPNAAGGPMTRSGIEQRLRVAVARASVADPSLRRHRISPHVIRHTTAMHLLQSGVDLSAIAMWLGHESIETTHQYLDADLESKRRALTHLQSPAVRPTRANTAKPLIRFLESL